MWPTLEDMAVQIIGFGTGILCLPFGQDLTFLILVGRWAAFGSFVLDICCPTIVVIHCGVHMMMMWDVHYESHSLSLYVLKFYLNTSPSYHTTNHHINIIISIMLWWLWWNELSIWSKIWRYDVKVNEIHNEWLKSSLCEPHNDVPRCLGGLVDDSNSRKILLCYDYAVNNLDLLARRDNPTCGTPLWGSHNDGSKPFIMNFIKFHDIFSSFTLVGIPYRVQSITQQ